MKLIVQRVTHASVTKKDTNVVIGKIGHGLFVLLGIKKTDTQKQADELVTKLVKLRIMADESQKMNLSILDTTKQILVVSQFTLYANTKDGNRPSFIDAEEPNKAKALYEYFVNKLREFGLKIETGSFGDYMNINASLDGPVTLILEN